MKSILMLCLLLVIPTTLSAQEKVKAAEKEALTAPTLSFEDEIARGKAAYGSGDYKVAIDAFLKAYDLRPTASLLYNVARSFDAQGNLEEAEVYYNRFIGAPGVSQSARADAVSRLKTVRDIQRMKEEDKHESEVKESKTEPKEKIVVKEADPVSPVAWLMMGIGGASLGAGVVTGLLSQAKFDHVESLGYPDEVASEDFEEVKSSRDAGQDLKISSVVLLASGSLLFIGGLITYFVTKPSAEKSAWNVQPTLAPHSAGLQISKSW